MIREIPSYGWGWSDVKNFFKPVSAVMQDAINVITPLSPAAMITKSVLPGGIMSPVISKLYKQPEQKTVVPPVSASQQQIIDAQKAAQGEMALYLLQQQYAQKQPSEEKTTDNFIEKYQTPLLLGAAGLGLILLLRR